MRQTLRNLRNDAWGAFARETIVNFGWSAPLVLGRAAIARATMGFEPRRTAMSGLHLRPVNAQRDYLRYHGQLEAGLQTLNWQGGGHHLIEDKVATAERLLSVDIPTAPIIAVIGRDAEAYPHPAAIPNLSTSQAIVDMLAAAPAELFMKPAGGDRGKDVMAPVRVGHDWQVGDRVLSPAAFADHLLTLPRGRGLLVQPRLKSHPDMAAIGGDLGLSTVRINTALRQDGPTVLFAFLKIMGSKGLVDNFNSGKYGNLLANVDIRTGEVVRVVGRLPGQRFFLQPIDRHPVTGAPLLGYRLPFWQEAKALALRCAAACPESPLLGADTAITAAGPTIMEINADWDANVPQVTTGRGLRAILREVWPDLSADPKLKERAAGILKL